MNKEQFRKELEDCWDDGYENGMCLNAAPRKQAKEEWVTTRLAALDDGYKNKNDTNGKEI